MIRVGALSLLEGDAPSAIAARLSLYTDAAVEADEPAPLKRAA